MRTAPPKEIDVRKSMLAGDVEVKLEREGEHVLARVPELGNLSTFGNNPEQAIEMAADAIRQYLETCLSTNRQMPIGRDRAQEILNKLT